VRHRLVIKELGADVSVVFALALSGRHSKEYCGHRDSRSPECEHGTRGRMKISAVKIINIIDLDAWFSGNVA
jgi:hypothetical protein